MLENLSQPRRHILHPAARQQLPAHVVRVQVLDFLASAGQHRDASFDHAESMRTSGSAMGTGSGVTQLNPSGLEHLTDAVSGQTVCDQQNAGIITYS